MEALISFMGERKRKKKHVGGKKEKKKNLCVCNPETRTLALHAFLAFKYSMPTH